MHVVALIASDIDAAGNPVLRAGDRAAAQWGQAQGGACQVRHPPGDVAAAAFAAAVGAAVAVWSDSERIDADLVLIGPGAIDRWGDELAGGLAERYSAELLFDVEQLERAGTIWSVVCDAGRGARDALRIAGNLVAVLSEHVARPPYVSRFRRAHAAKAIPIDQAVAQCPSLWQPVAPRRKRAAVAEQAGAEDRTNATFGISSAAVDSRSRQMISDSPAVCAQVLLRYLVHHGFVHRALPESAPPPAAALLAPPPDHAAPAATPSVVNGLTPALRRSHRRTGDDERRRARRPRISATASPAIRPAHIALARGPRRPEARLPAGRRGPFRVSSTLDRSSH